MKSALAIFAHPDDAELTCFGTLALLRSLGYGVVVAIVTDGLAAVNNNGTYNRLEEAAESSALMGFRLIRAGLPDGDLHFGNTLIKEVERWFAEIEPAVVITHYLDPEHVDHQDHFVVAHAVLNVAQRMAKFDLLLEAEPSRGSRSFAPNLFVNVARFAAEKSAAIACYRSQTHKHYFTPAHLELRSRWWAEASGAGEICGNEEGVAIEAFRIVRSSLLGEGAAFGFRRCEPG